MAVVRRLSAEVYGQQHGHLLRKGCPGWGLLCFVLCGAAPRRGADVSPAFFPALDAFLLAGVSSGLQPLLSQRALRVSRPETLFLLCASHVLVVRPVGF